jgi:transposase
VGIPEWCSRAEEEDLNERRQLLFARKELTVMISAAIERCAGIDVHKKFLAVCVMVGPLEGEPRIEKRRYGTTVAELNDLREWLRSESVTHVVMESTGSYWKPVFNVLEDAVRVYLANPQEVKNRKGHKTDDKDGWWLAHLLRHAMIQPSFIPPRAIRELRDLTRRRKRLLGNSTSERNRVQKILEDANVKLGNVLSDVFGASGQLMLDALLEGQATPVQVAQLAQRKAKKKIPQIIAALEGHQMSAHHRQLIRYSLDHLQFLEEQVLKLDNDIAAKIREAQLEPQWQLLQTVPAIRETSAATILAETGGDMTTFPSVKHLSSWAGLCPGNNRSAGKNKSSHTTGGNPWLRSSLVECSWAATVKRNCFLREKFWRIVTKTRDHKKGPALIAVAHTLLQLVFQVLSTGKPYVERGQPPLDERQRNRIIRHHVRRLGKLGIGIYSMQPAATAGLGRPLKAVLLEPRPQATS